MRRLGVGILTLAALVAPATAQANDWRSCGSNTGTGWTAEGQPVDPGAGNFHVRAREVSCRKARYIVTHHSRWDWWHNADYSRVDHWRGPWYCVSRSTGYERGRSICRASGGRRVKWGTGA
jgi:hypothetical protein